MRASGVTGQTVDVAVLPEAGAPGTFHHYWFVSAAWSCMSICIWCLTSDMTAQKVHDCTEGQQPKYHHNKNFACEYHSVQSVTHLFSWRTHSLQFAQNLGH